MRYIWDDSPLEIPDGMVMVCVYTDTTGLYTPDETDECNLAYLLFPEEIVEAWYHKKLADIYPASWTMKEWASTANRPEDTMGLCDFARKRGFEPRRRPL